MTVCRPMPTHAGWYGFAVGVHLDCICAIPTSRGLTALAHPDILWLSCSVAECKFGINRGHKRKVKVCSKVQTLYTVVLGLPASRLAKCFSGL